MAARFFARRNEVEPTVLHAFDRLLGYTGFWRIAFIIGGIDREERGFDAIQSG